MRSSVVLIVGLLAIGDAEALAVTAPLGVEPREDLFAPKPRSTAPGLASPPAIPAAEHLPEGNPLWAIPLGRLTATRERPLFAPTRHPPPIATGAKPVAAPMAPPPKPAEPEKPQLSLLGTVSGGGAAAGVGLFIDSSSKTVLRLKAGENHKGWVLRAVRPHQVELAGGLDSAVLDLPPPDMKASTAPALAAVMPASPTPVSPALSVNTATGALPPATLAGAPTGAQAPTFKPPPAQVNPFQNKWLH